MDSNFTLFNLHCFYVRNVTETVSGLTIVANLEMSDVIEKFFVVRSAS